MAAAETQSETLKALYLTAATIKPRTNVFFIGPYGKRVSFASQQQRAFNTVWALYEAGKIKEGARVAVIGAGLCGLTVAAALLAKRCLVWIYESLPDVLELQSRATHRFVHPTINFWPEPESEPYTRPTTRFPFFDWYESLCATNILRLKQEWQSHFRDRVNRVYFETDVSEVTYDATTNRVNVSASGGIAPSVAEYDIVVIATGFGVEKSVTGATSSRYWEPDFLSERVGRANNIVVSGTGDGGLVDALRAVHRNFSDGRLIVQLAQHLTERGIAARVRDCEREVALKCGADDEAAAKLFAVAYEEIANETPPICTDILNGSYYSKKRVTLFGHLSQPFSLSSAPIHKYMIAHAIAAGKIEYKQGELIDGPSFGPVGGPYVPVVADLCIVRHGADPPLAKLKISASEISELKQTQMKIADLLGSTPYAPSFWDGIRGYPKQDFASIDFIRFRYPPAAMYSIERYRRPIGIRAQDGQRGFVMINVGADISDDFVPKDLFGIPLFIEDEEIAYELSA